MSRGRAALAVVGASTLAGCVGELVPIQCSRATDAYSPYPAASGGAVGSVLEHPWRGRDESGYPDGVEDFRIYGGAASADIECSADKSRRAYLDVTDGCLQAVAQDDGGTVGRVGTVSDHFRAVALAFSAGRQAVEWTDAAVEFRFLVPDPVDPADETGLKAFVRYRSEDDLYVASWRFDGVVQIQRKSCGRYDLLARLTDQAPPPLDAWHTLRFAAVGDDLELSIDGALVLSATGDAEASGTAGIRIDAPEGVLIDDWRIDAP